jgi:plasmid stabilization system protein ParE
VKLVWSPLALSRVEEIVEYIGCDRPGVAREWVVGLFENVNTLAMFPQKGRVVREVGRADIREIVYKRHRVVYKTEAARVAILTVRHGRRLLDLNEIQIEP